MATVQLCKIFENDLIIAILAKDQIRPGHCLIIPKIETEHFSQLSQLYLYEIHAFSQKLSIALKQVTNCVRIGGLFAGWDINHVHYHLVPMHEYGDLDHTKGKPLPHEEMIELQLKIKTELNKIFTDQKIISEEREQIKLLQSHLKKKITS